MPFARLSSCLANIPERRLRQLPYGTFCDSWQVLSLTINEPQDVVAEVGKLLALFRPISAILVARLLHGATAPACNPLKMHGSELQHERNIYSAPVSGKSLI